MLSHASKCYKGLWTCARVHATRSLSESSIRVPDSRPHQTCGSLRRVIALLEVYIKRVPDSPHLPAMVPPLLQALERASKPSGSPALAQRLQARLHEAYPHPAATLFV